MLIDVIKTKKEVKGLQKAIEFFCRDSVVVETVETAIQLGRKGFSKLITFDGTIFSNGLLSGGYIPESLTKGLGLSKVDQTLKKLDVEIKEVQIKIKEERLILENIET